MITAVEARELVKTQEEVNLSIRDVILGQFEQNVKALSDMGKDQFPESIKIIVPEIMKLVNGELIDNGYSTVIDPTGEFLIVGWGENGIEVKEEENDK